jgi:2-keto-4-pentenoate hydratase
MPSTEADAYGIQDAARRMWPDAVVGWKVGLIQPPFDRQLGRSRLFGPIFAGAVRQFTDLPVTFGRIAGGFAAVEAEYVLRLGVDVAPKLGRRAAEAGLLVDALFAGVEFAGSPFPEINDHGPLVTISDFGNNAGLLLGPRLPGLSALGDEACSMWIDGSRVGTGSPASIPGGPLGSLVELLDHMGRRGEVLPAGTLVSTGAATGVHAVHTGQAAIADFGVHGRLEVRIERALPC